MARPKPLADLLDVCLGRALAAQGFASADILTAWPEIAGARLAAACRPVRIDWGRRGLRDRDERPQPVVSGNADLPTIVYSVKGRQAIVGVTSYAEEDFEAELTIDAGTLGFDDGYTVTNAETGEAVSVQDDRVRVPLRKHDVCELRIVGEGG